MEESRGAPDGARDRRARGSGARGARDECDEQRTAGRRCASSGDVRRTRTQQRAARLLAAAAGFPDCTEKAPETLNSGVVQQTVCKTSDVHTEARSRSTPDERVAAETRSRGIRARTPGPSCPAERQLARRPPSAAVCHLQFMFIPCFQFYIDN